MRAIKAALMILWGCAAVGAAAQQAPTSPPTSPGASSKKPIQYDSGTRPKPAPGTTLRGAVVYVYSFLDTRADTVGMRGIARFHDRLLQALNGADVQTKLLSFGDSDAASMGHSGSEYSRPLPKSFPNLRETKRAVPVRATIAGNQSNEAAAGTKYRLVLFPSYTSQFGRTASFDVDWTLTDVATGKVIWVFSTTTWYGPLGKPALTGTIDNAMASLRKSGLIN